MTAPTWLHEQFDPTGSAIGFRVTAKLDEVQSEFQKIEVWESTDWGNVMLNCRSSAGSRVREPPRAARLRADRDR